MMFCSRRARPREPREEHGRAVGGGGVACARWGGRGGGGGEVGGGAPRARASVSIETATAASRECFVSCTRGPSRAARALRDRGEEVVGLRVQRREGLRAGGGRRRDRAAELEQARARARASGRRGSGQIRAAAPWSSLRRRSEKLSSVRDRRAVLPLRRTMARGSCAPLLGAMPPATATQQEQVQVRRLRTLASDFVRRTGAPLSGVAAGSAPPSMSSFVSSTTILRRHRGQERGDRDCRASAREARRWRHRALAAAVSDIPTARS